MKVNVLGTGWDPEYYSSGVRISFDQNFGNGVLTPIADEIVVPPDSNGRFSFTYTIPKGFRQGDIISISGLIGNGGGRGRISLSRVADKKVVRAQLLSRTCNPRQSNMTLRPCA
jgi:hypothetical protein